MNYILKKQFLWILFCLTAFSLNGIFWKINDIFQEDILVLKSRQNQVVNDIREASFFQKQKKHFDHLAREMDQERYVGSMGTFKATRQLIEKAFHQHNLMGGNLKSEAVQVKDNEKYQRYSLFFETALDTDFFDFLETFSKKLNGVMIPRLVTLFRQENGFLKGEFSFYLVTCDAYRVPAP
tara:strand:- start:4105 stop:4647 length:543 start_codon:yes stop_codon:yes gene_type:complete